MSSANDSGPLPDGGIHSLLDTDLYKLTMQSAVLKYFPQVEVTYSFTNRTPHMKLSRAAFQWLEKQIDRLGSMTVSSEEFEYLKNTCSYFSEQYLHFLKGFRFRPAEQIQMTFNPEKDSGQQDDHGSVDMHIKGLWVDTILYEIPLLALTSEAYFRFCDRDWTYDGQVENARDKGLELMKHGCMTSEFGSRRRRDYHTHDLVLQGLRQATEEAAKQQYAGKITGTSNVHFAMKYGIPPIGTVAHEWFMGVAAVTQSYTAATETALSYWIATFGKGVLGIALTDTFGTPAFLRAFTRPVPATTIPRAGAEAVSATSPSTTVTSTQPPIAASDHGEDNQGSTRQETYAEVFIGTRQDSGSPLEFIQTMRDFYDAQGITEKKTIVFSDSLNVDRCIEYKKASEAKGFQPSFGVGTYFTNDFARTMDGSKSVPLNIVIKLSSANGNPAVKISDNIGKNTGDQATVERIKRELGYTEKAWTGGNEQTRWGVDGAKK